ncbi:ABC transporter substrate-binding protein [Celeribacter indicus]|uniref:Oligopeptide ABC transporter substrate binding protein n=1 Tax=Celeribacter indicus TaxID=1208324 RepID=A0A0B5E1M1_9RHOB|nr:ABC transporter substrate-binding protein [Celeribacter indicus]AJE46367.1 oligopeptide ABC transporter substrate binding protein [Celeribacter indicus]SDW54723.1 peptide/nickel transport system substrate-binding protein [Celeribacter indicus]
MDIRFLKSGVACGVLAASFAFGGLAPALAKTPEDTLVYGTSLAQVISLDPHQGQEVTSLEIMANLYDRLVASDAEGNLSPQLAESWDIDDEGITFHLRDATFNDTGNPVTAEDVVWSIRRVLKLNQAPAAKLGSTGYTAENIDSLTEALDEKTFRISLTGDVAADFLLYRLSEVAASVVEKAEVMSHDRDGDMGNDWLRTHAAGSGPFDLQRWAPNDIVIMNADEDNWSGAPVLSRVVMRHVPESQAERLMLERGDIDIAGALSPMDIAYFRDRDGVEIRGIPTGGFYALAMNVTEEPYSNPKVREAIFHAIDYEGIETAIMGPYGKKRLLPVPESYAGALPDPDWTYDPDLARELLAEAGYPDGFDTNIKVISQTPRVELATAVQAGLAEIGITASITQGSGADIVPDHRSRNFQLLIPQTAAYMPNAMGAMEQFSNNPDNAPEANNAGNFVWRSGWDIPELTDLTTRTLKENDAEKRIEMYGEMQEAFVDAVPAILPMFERFLPLAISTDVKGYEGHPQQVTRLDKVSKAE